MLHSAITDNLKYCYKQASCFGEKPINASDTMTRSDCCDNTADAKGWGVSGGHCDSCFIDDNSGYQDPALFTPDQPNSNRTLTANIENLISSYRLCYAEGS